MTLRLHSLFGSFAADERARDKVLLTASRNGVWESVLQATCRVRRFACVAPVASLRFFGAQKPGH